MSLTDRERQILALLRGNPLLGSDAIADRLGTTRAAVNVHLSNLGKKGAILGRGYVLADEPGVVVVGGANMDIKARSDGAAVAGTSNPGSATFTPGGVGRNIAENLARLGTRVQLVAAVGSDPLGDTLLGNTSDAGVHTAHVLRTAAPTGTYTAVLDADGELAVAVSDMAATAELVPAVLDGARDLLASTDLLVLDTNLPGETLSYAAHLAVSAGVRTILEPVSVAKAAVTATLPGLLDPAHPLFVITPNRDEATAMTGLPTGTDAELRAAADALHDRGVEWAWIRLGGRGSLLSGPGGATFLDAYPAEIVDVTGAGDSLLAGFCHALLAGADPVDAARFGHATATLTIASRHTVRPDLTATLVASTLDAHHPPAPAGHAGRGTELPARARAADPTPTKETVR